MKCQNTFYWKIKIPQYKLLFSADYFSTSKLVIKCWYCTMQHMHSTCITDKLASHWNRLILKREFQTDIGWKSFKSSLFLVLFTGKHILLPFIPFTGYCWWLICETKRYNRYVCIISESPESNVQLFWSTVVWYLLVFTLQSQPL